MRYAASCLMLVFALSSLGCDSSECQSDKDCGTGGRCIHPSDSSDTYCVTAKLFGEPCTEAHECQNDDCSPTHRYCAEPCVGYGASCAQGEGRCDGRNSQCLKACEVSSDCGDKGLTQRCVVSDAADGERVCI